MTKLEELSWGKEIDRLFIVAKTHTVSAWCFATMRAMDIGKMKTALNKRTIIETRFPDTEILRQPRFSLTLGIIRWLLTTCHE
jgi:hypothetical protein